MDNIIRIKRSKIKTTVEEVCKTSIEENYILLQGSCYKELFTINKKVSISVIEIFLSVPLPVQWKQKFINNNILQRIS